MQVLQSQALQVNTTPLNQFPQTWDFRSLFLNQSAFNLHSSFYFCLLSVSSQNKKGFRETVVPMSTKPGDFP